MYRGGSRIWEVWSKLKQWGFLLKIYFSNFFWCKIIY